MASRKYGACPAQHALLRWYRNQVRRNLERLADEGKSMRLFGFGVTEAQLNRRFRLVPGQAKPGDVLKKLEGCGLPFVDKRVSTKEDEGLMLAISQKNQRVLRKDKNSEQ